MISFFFVDGKAPRSIADHRLGAGSVEIELGPFPAAMQPENRKKVIEYAEYIGMDLSGADRTLLWLAEDGLNAPLPEVSFVMDVDQEDFKFRSLRCCCDMPDSLQRERGKSDS